MLIKCQCIDRFYKPLFLSLLTEYISLDAVIIGSNTVLVFTRFAANSMSDDGVPIVEDFTSQFADFLLVLVPVALAVPFEARHQALDGRRGTALAVMDALDQAAQVAH